MPSHPGEDSTLADGALDAARQLLLEGRLAEAEQSYQRILAAQPEQIEALRFLASRALARSAPGKAVELLTRAASIDRNHIGVLLELGVAYRDGERLDAARYVLERALELRQGRNTTVRLVLANVLERDQRPELALLHYFRAILDAQHAGRWLDDSTTQPSLRPLVQHAMRYTSSGRRTLFDGSLRPWRDDNDATRLDRIDRALGAYLRERSEAPADPRQRPSLLYVPGLDATRVLDNARFGWLHAFQAHTATSAAEVNACLAQQAGPSGTSAFVLGNLAGATATGGQAAQPSERHAEIYSHGPLSEASQRNAPQLLAALAGTPLVHMPQHDPDAEIIVLAPTTRTAVRHGRTNAYCGVVVMLPGSARAEIVVGAESHDLHDGEALVFDSSYSVEYANTGTAEARMLTFEIWHPDLTPVEREALTAMTTAIVDFDARLQELA